MTALYRVLVAVCLGTIAVAPAIASEMSFSVRAIWADASSINTAQKVDVLLDKCKRAKINVILADMMTHGVLRHKSTHFLHRSVAAGEFDPLEYLTSEAHRAGIEVHPWYCVYYEGTASLQPARPQWLCTNINGVRMSDPLFLSPQVPGVNDYLLSVIQDGLAYPVDGVHLDYIRYYGTQYDYSDLGRQGFIEEYGFDPINFLDRSESIVPLEDDPFPIRVMRSNTQLTKVWEATWAESIMDYAGVGFGFISENPEAVDALPVPGALVLNNFYGFSQEMADAIDRYVQRGGNTLWMHQVPMSMATVRSVVGIYTGSASHAEGWRELHRLGSTPLSLLIPEERFFQSLYVPTNMAAGATRVAFYDTGEPAVIYNERGSGRSLFITFNVAGVYSKSCAQMVHDVLGWLRSQSGVTSQAEPMKEKRAQWVQWKSEQVTDLVRKVRTAAKAKDPGIKVSIAGGFNAGETALIFRDSRKWLQDGLLDCGMSMDYCDNLDLLCAKLESHSEVATEEQRKTIFPGLALYTKNSSGSTVSQDASVLEAQLDLVYQMGFRGYTLFAAVYLNEEHIAVLSSVKEPVAGCLMAR